MNRIWIPVVSLLLFAPFAQADEPRRPTIDDLDGIKSPQSLSISPDGNRIVYALDGQLFVADRRRESPRALTAPGSSAWNPRWSNDGNGLYFVSNRSGKAQLWRLPVAGFGEAEQLTRFEHGVSSTNLSPDETRIALTFAASDLAPADNDDALPEPFVVQRRQFKRDRGEGYLTPADTRHIHILDLASGELRQLTDGPFDEGQPMWSPDGRTIAFVSNRESEPDASYRSDIWTIAADGSDEPLRLTDDKAQKSSPAFSPDGRSLAFLTAGDGVYSVPHIAIVGIGGGEARLLTADLDRWIGDFGYSEDGRFIYASYDNAGSTELARIRVSDGRLQKLIDGEVNVSQFDVGPDSTLAVRMNGQNDGPDVHLLRDSRLQRLTDLHADYFAKVRVGEKRKVAFDSKDGTRVESFITLPPDYVEGRRYPTILNIHGGPVGQFAWGYSFRAQFLAANGYVVVEPNPRGSTGFGEEYIRAIYRTWGITDYDDVIAAVDYAIEAGLADPGRLAVTGYSYGGYMTNVVITGTDRFKAAASGAGHSLIEANFGHDIYQQWYMWELGYPWDNRELYDVLSPFLRAGNVVTPTLFLGGRIDWNVPILNAELMYQALKVRDIDTELVVYPGVHHGGWPVEYDKDYLERVVAWFDQYVKDSHAGR